LSELHAKTLSGIEPSGKITWRSVIADIAMKVLSLEAARARLRPARPVLPPPVLTGPIPVDARAHPADADEDRIRMRQNMLVLLVIVAIVGLGSWLIDSLRYYSRIQTCIEAGHRNCVPVDHKYQPSPY
jgi:hypothetical protein